MPDWKYDILFISFDDIGNVGADWAEACRSIGMKALAICEIPAWFGPRNMETIVPFGPSMQEYSKDARVVVHMHTRVDPIHRVDGQKWIAFHGGTRYRVNPAGISSRINGLFDMTWVQTGELLGYGKNERWVMATVDTEYLYPHFSDPDMISEAGLWFAHYPRPLGHGPQWKGTKVIENVMSKFRHAPIMWSCNIEQKTWEENMVRMSEPDIYIERMSNHCKEWGITALEAAALGKVIITQFESKDRYEKEFECECPLIVANTPGELEKAVNHLISMSPDEIVDIQMKTRKWVETVHGYNPTALRIKRFIEEVCDAHS